MGKWTSLLITTMLLTSSRNQESNHGCSYETLLTNGKQITCVNISAAFFQYFALNLNRSRWLTCKNCNLSAITNDTFNFPKNTIGYLILIDNNVINVSNLAFSKLPLLKVLSLKHNFIKHLNLGTFYGIKKLLQLDLSNNKLEKLEEKVFSDLENLDILNLNDNQINYINSDAFIGLTNLKYLYVNQNKIKILTNDMFKYLPNLKILYLENNKIAEIRPLAFNRLENLNFLYLNNNSINFLVQYNFKPLASLIDLQLRFNNLTEIETSTFNGLKSIKFLYLGQNKVKRIRPYGFIGLNTLQVLDLIDNEFDFFSLNYFKDMENLNTLWLENNMINNFSIHHYSNPMVSLKVINLVDNQLDHFNYVLLLQKVPQLEEIWIGRNPWKCNFIIEMYDYFHYHNVSVCTRTNCSTGAVQSLIQKICFEPFQNETELSTEFIMDYASRNIFSVLLLFILSLLHYFHNVFISTSF